jgi:predicted site-specific integrase-resolvase
MHHQRTRPAPGAEPFLLTNQVADLLHVTPNIVARWAQHGRLPHQRTLGGHRHYPTIPIEQLAASLAQEVRAA